MVKIKRKQLQKLSDSLDAALKIEEKICPTDEDWESVIRHLHKARVRLRKIMEPSAGLNVDFIAYGDFENPLFLAQDAAEWIEYDGRAGQLIKAVDDGEKLMHMLYASGQNRKMWLKEG